METIQHGNRSPATMFLQVLLNKGGANPRLDPDGIFGTKTRQSTIDFQSASGITPANGIVDSRTWSMLGSGFERIHPIRLFGQPNSSTCWSAASTMMHGTNQSVGPGQSNLASDGGLNTQMNNIEGFVSSNGWRMINRQSAPPVGVLTSALTQGPLWIAFQLTNLEHAVVISGFYSHKDRSEDGTVLIVHDPWPPGRGSIYGSPYSNREVVLRSVSAHPRAIIQYAAGR